MVSNQIIMGLLQGIYRLSHYSLAFIVTPVLKGTRPTYIDIHINQALEKKYQNFSTDFKNQIVKRILDRKLMKRVFCTVLLPVLKGMHDCSTSWKLEKKCHIMRVEFNARLSQRSIRPHKARWFFKKTL